MAGKGEAAEKRVALGCTDCRDCLNDPDTNCEECDCSTCCDCCFEATCSARVPVSTILRKCAAE